MDFIYAIIISLTYEIFNVAAEPVVVASPRQNSSPDMAAPLLDTKVAHRLSPRKAKHRPAGCSMTCMRRMKQDIDDDEEFSQFILKQSKPYRFQSQFDDNMLRKYCQKMNKTMNCVNPCPGGTVKTIAMQALSLPKYMCIETRFFDYAPCFKRVTKRMEKICHLKSRCGEHKFELETFMNNPLSNAEDVNRLVQSTCKYEC
uniref:Uncharacterized protein n=1 Tax=Romanomermis culicivorax TaxID=13658 RepID=A0A915HHZ4_ROMCU